MVQRLKSELRTLWQMFVQGFVGAASGAILVGVGAFITGIYDRIHMIDTIAERQVEFSKSVVKILETQEKLKEADGKLRETVAGFSGEHKMITDEMARLRDVIGGSRRSGGQIH